MNDKPMWIKRDGLQGIILDEEREGYTKVVDWVVYDEIKAVLAKTTAAWETISKTIDHFTVKAEREHELAKKLVEAAGELLAIESQKNLNKVQEVNGVKFYPVGGNYQKNAAYYRLDRTINEYRQFLEEGFNP